MNPKLLAEFMTNKDICPYCGESNISCSTPEEPSRPTLELHWMCDSCDSKWVAVYRLESVDHAETQEL